MRHMPRAALAGRDRDPVRRRFVGTTWLPFPGSEPSRTTVDAPPECPLPGVQTTLTSPDFSIRADWQYILLNQGAHQIAHRCSVDFGDRSVRIDGSVSSSV
jgi:hypothetical protein